MIAGYKCFEALTIPTLVPFKFSENFFKHFVPIRIKKPIHAKVNRVDMNDKTFPMLS